MATINMTASITVTVPDAQLQGVDRNNLFTGSFVRITPNKDIFPGSEVVGFFTEGDVDIDMGDE